jgi:hypothetical protein
MSSIILKILIFFINFLLLNKKSILNPNGGNGKRDEFKIHFLFELMVQVHFGVIYKNNICVIKFF